MSFNMNSDAALRVAHYRNVEDRQRADAWRRARAARQRSVEGDGSAVREPVVEPLPPMAAPRRRRLSWSGLLASVRARRSPA